MKSKLDLYIKEGWAKARTTGTEEDLDMPFPYIPPSIDGLFRTLYYWDTYFTNIGLNADGHTDWARENVDNLLFALNHFGCVPNYTRKGGADFCSQPPLLSLMVRDIYMWLKDEEWLKVAVQGLEKEYKFWMTERITPIGLNQYGCNAKDEKVLLDYFDYASDRVTLDKNLPKEEKLWVAKNFVAEAESGQDYNPRYDHHNSLDYVQIDLNSHLYGLEDFLCNYFDGKDKEKYEYYKKQKEKRVELIEKYCYNEELGVYCDYDFVSGKKNDIICTACFLPYFYGFAKEKSGAKRVYDVLKCKGGVVACQDTGDREFQWGYPYIWAPCQFFAYNALKNSGFECEAEELRLNYVNLLSSVYEKTGALWERYEEDGEAKDLEYPNQQMLGWTAGVYRYFCMQDKNCEHKI
ncbi:MAG: hypothetical protein IKA99_08450 [Clostridia bacterium]|nr:hypothetical protein [Clostridia bacterium]